MDSYLILSSMNRRLHFLKAGGFFWEKKSPPLAGAISGLMGAPMLFGEYKDFVV